MYIQDITGGIVRVLAGEQIKKQFGNKLVAAILNF